MGDDGGGTTLAVVLSGATAVGAVVVAVVVLASTVAQGRRAICDAVAEERAAARAVAVSIDVLARPVPAVIAASGGTSGDLAALADLARRAEATEARLGAADRLVAALDAALAALPAASREDWRMVFARDRARLDADRAALEARRAAVEAAASGGAGRIAAAVGLGAASCVGR